MKKLIFLDIDGVLNSLEFMYGPNSSWTSDKTTQIDPNGVELLNQLIDATQAEVVLSSTWRILHYDILKTILNDMGCKANIIDKTPTTHYKAKKFRHCQRGCQIQEWLDNHKDIFDIEKGDKFIILDDGNDMGHLTNHLVLTFLSVGLTKKNVEDSIERLNKNNDGEII